MAVTLYRSWQMALAASCLAMGSMTLNSVALAAGLPITPGLWEVTTENPLLGSQEVQQACMKSTVFDPRSMMDQEQRCDIVNEVVSGNSVDYDVVCVDQQAGKAEGHLAFTIDGDKGNGKIDMTMTLAGQSFNMQVSLDAKRIGDC